MNEDNRAWAGPKGTINYTAQGNAEPPVPIPVFKPLKIDDALTRACRDWTWRNKLARECYHREGKGVVERPRRVRSVLEKEPSL